MLSRALINAGSLVCQMRKTAALSILPYTREFEKGIALKISKDDEKKSRIDYSDISHSVFLRTLNIQATEDGSTKIIPDLQSRLFKITELCEKAANEVRKPRETDSEFKTNLQEQIKKALGDNNDFSAVLKLRDKVLQLPGEIDHYILRIVLNMRKKLYLKCALISKENIDKVLSLNKYLGFEDGSTVDLFIVDQITNTPRHLLIDKNTIFAINCAVHFHFFNHLEKFKKKVLDPRLCLGYQFYYPSKYYEVLKDMTKLKYTIALIGIEQTGDGHIQDIVLSHGDTHFEYGAYNSEKFFLQPKLSLNSDTCIPASIVSIFDQLSVFNNIEQLRAVCHSEMEIYVDYFYCNLVYLLPSLRNIEVEECIEGKAQNFQYSDTCRPTVINDVLDRLMLTDSLLKNITAFNIVGYTMLTNDSINKLKSSNFTSFGLFGRYQLRDFFYNYLILDNECSLSKSLKSYTGSLEGVFLAIELLNDSQLKNVTFNLNDQIYVYEKVPIENCSLIKQQLGKYFKNHDFTETVLRKKNYSFDSISIVQKPRIIVDSSELGAVPCRQTPKQEKFINEAVQYILKYFQSNILYMDAGIAEFNPEIQNSFKTIEFSIKPNAMTEASMSLALQVLCPQEGEIVFNYPLKIRIQDIISDFERCVVYMAKNTDEDCEKLDENPLELSLTLHAYNTSDYEKDYIRSCDLKNKIWDALKGSPYRKHNVEINHPALKYSEKKSLKRKLQ
ncbi:hypothetical protein ENBRE01_1164 [Enteropsectra breve]|nr:hypothetical protein ENBRE01_1164 [Enteropsectra breve]